MSETKPIHAKPSLYALYFEIIKSIGLKYGYNIVLHGSLNRDLDLIGIGWQETLGDVDEMIDEIADLIGGKVMAQCQTVETPEGVRFQKTHHGRKQYVINIHRDFKFMYNAMKVEKLEYKDPQYYIDISIV